MFVYEKKLQYPVKIKNPNPKLAAVIISQYGGPDINRLQNERIKPESLSSPASLYFSTGIFSVLPPSTGICTPELPWLPSTGMVTPLPPSTGIDTPADLPERHGAS